MILRGEISQNKTYPPPKLLPAISVVIPMYNVEKYIGECLDSILTQTFQNFEVIVVDDCSADSSVEIVENYASKFDGRLTLERLEKNSGEGGYVPRNKAMKLSRGEYIFFLDADDTITPTAFEELYALAKTFDADVVQCEKFFKIPDEHWHDAEYRKKLKPANYLTGENKIVKAPVLLPENLVQRANFFSQRKLPWNIWLQLIRRDFIVRNELKFAAAVAQDMIFTICEICCAEKYVIVPNVVNYYRIRENSVTKEKIDDKQKLRKWTKTIRVGLRALDDFLSGRKVFSDRPDLKYSLFDVFMTQMLDGVFPAYQKFPPHELDEILRAEFCDGDNTALTAFVFSGMNSYRLQLLQSFAHINALQNEIRRLNSKE